MVIDAISSSSFCYHLTVSRCVKAMQPNSLANLESFSKNPDVLALRLLEKKVTLHTVASMQPFHIELTRCVQNFKISTI